MRAGQRIGYEGATGHASGCHVHYGLFSPLETKTFGVRADIIKHLRTPTLEIARIDPLIVLPGGAEAAEDPPRADAGAARRANRVTGGQPHPLAPRDIRESDTWSVRTPAKARSRAGFVLAGAWHRT